MINDFAVVRTKNTLLGIITHNIKRLKMSVYKAH